MIELSAPQIGAAEREAVLRVLDSGRLAQGPEVAALEREFAQAHHAAHVRACSSGTTALALALAAAGVGPGDEVVTTPFTFIASLHSILHAGGVPVLADIEPGSFNLDPAAAERAITPRTKAILLVHLYGYPCDLHAFRALAARHGLRLIEDCAQALGSRHAGEPVGRDDLGAFSLYATKNIMAGEGGLCTFAREAEHERAGWLRQHGMRERYEYLAVGHNYRMSDLHAAIARAQLPRLAEWTAARQAHAAFYDHALAGSVQTPARPLEPGSEHSYHQYTVRLAGALSGERDAVVNALAARGVRAGVFYPEPMHRLPHLQGKLRAPEPLPHAEQAAREVFSLPVHPRLTEAERHQVAAAVRGVLGA